MRKRPKKRIVRCRSCDEIIRIDGEWQSGCSRTHCASCRYIERSPRRSRHADEDVHDLMFYSDLDEFDYEMIENHDFDLEYFLQ